MKKIVIILVISLFATVNYAKPAYCLAALGNCNAWCEEQYD